MINKIELVTNNVFDKLIAAIQRSERIYILTSFIMESGVKLISPYIEEAISRGTKVNICTGDYLYITQPHALEKLLKISPKIEIRLFKSNGKSFHPKAYIFESGENGGTLIVGSSNLSASALKTGVEWNLVMPEVISNITFDDALNEFAHLFQHEQTVQINSESIKLYKEQFDTFHKNNPNLHKKWTKNEEIDLMLPVGNKVKEGKNTGETTIITGSDPYGVITPRPSQVEALQALKDTFEEGYSKAMVVMATGLGKTYLAGFFAQHFKRILFVAHREEILEQAKESFKNIMPEKSYGLYYSKEKSPEADCLFASIYTVGMERHFERFSPNHFDLIIVDEFHHAAAKSYMKLINYFKPKFLLGITATPDRMDGKDVYALCDGNIAYQIHFLEAIDKGWLSPFRYYGVYDETDYSQITWLGTKYDEEELLAVQLKEEFAEKILQAWLKYKQTRSLGFCSSVRQADFLADYFKRKGNHAISLHSRTTGNSRSEAIRLLGEGELDIIFTVDLFNEGVDIPSVDTLLFARPTESLTVFTQQIGRGLRTFDGKQQCTIIDLIGNYRNADLKLGLFNTQPVGKSKKATVTPVVPDTCTLELDFRVIDLLKELANKRYPKKEQLKFAYLELKQEFGRRPTYLELHLQGNADSREYRQQFGSYQGFLKWADELSDVEQAVFKRNQAWIEEVEKTSMSKSYKMIVLLYMLTRGMEKWLDPVTPEEVAPFFHHYLTEKEYRRKIDFSDKSSRALWEYNERKIAKLLVDMPLTKWGKIASFEDNQFQFNIEVPEEDNSLVYEWTKQVCEYRLHWHFERKGAGI